MSETLYGLRDKTDGEVVIFDDKEERDLDKATYYPESKWQKVTLEWAFEKDELPTTAGSVVKTDTHGYLVLDGNGAWGNNDYRIASSLLKAHDYTIIFDNKEDDR